MGFNSAFKGLKKIAINVHNLRPRLAQLHLPYRSDNVTFSLEDGEASFFCVATLVV